MIESSDGLNIVKYLELADREEFLLSNILICFEGKDSCVNPIPQIEASLRNNQLKEGVTPENFPELANDNTTDPSRAGNGGDLGWAGPGAYVPAFELEVARTPVGAISNVVETNYGYHLIYKRDTRKVKAYDIQRVLMKLTRETDIVPPASPWKNTELSGKHLTRAQVEFDPNTNKPLVGISFNDDGGKLFADLTASHVGKPIAIFLDGSPISIPTVQQAIYGGKAVITGDFTLDEAKVLAQRLNAGALPVAVNLLSQQTVGPTLGAVSLQKSVRAALLGFVLVSLFMIAIYRLPGLIVSVALVLYMFLALALHRFFGVTISLSAIAGFVLSIGIAVDANVLVIERLRKNMALDATSRQLWKRRSSARGHLFVMEISQL